MNSHIATQAGPSLPRIRNAYLGAALVAALGLSLAGAYAIRADTAAPVSEASRAQVVRRVAPPANVAVMPHDVYLVAGEAQRAALLGELNNGRAEAGLPEITDSQVVIADGGEAEAAFERALGIVGGARTGLSEPQWRVFDMR